MTCKHLAADEYHKGVSTEWLIIDLVAIFLWPVESFLEKSMKVLNRRTIPKSTHYLICNRHFVFKKTTNTVSRTSVEHLERASSYLTFDFLFQDDSSDLLDLAHWKLTSFYTLAVRHFFTTCESTPTMPSCKILQKETFFKKEDFFVLI